MRFLHTADWQIGKPFLRFGEKAEALRAARLDAVERLGELAVAEGIAQHHERMNGSGYPKGLREAEIGIFGRMAGVADCFAALTKSRPYAEAVSSYEALRSISSWAGEYFHEALAAAQGTGLFSAASDVEARPAEHDLDYRTHFERRTRLAGAPVWRALLERSTAAATCSRTAVPLPG